MTDKIKHPSHYTKYSVEVIDITRYLPFCLGNVVKYVLRSPYKNGKQDLEKALQYLDWSIDQPIVIPVQSALPLHGAVGRLRVFIADHPMLYSVLLEEFMRRLHDVLFGGVFGVEALRPIIIGLHERMSAKPGIVAHERLLQRD